MNPYRSELKDKMICVSKKGAVFCC